MYYTDYMQNIKSIVNSKNKYTNLLMTFVGDRPEWFKQYADTCDWGFLYPPKSILESFDYSNKEDYIAKYWNYLEKLWNSIIFIFGAHASKDVVFLFNNEDERSKLHTSCLNKFLTEHAFPCEYFKY